MKVSICFSSSFGTLPGILGTALIWDLNPSSPHLSLLFFHLSNHFLLTWCFLQRRTLGISFLSASWTISTLTW